MGKTLRKVGEGKNFELFADSDGGKPTVIKLKRVRISFPHCGEQQEQEGEDGEKSKNWGVVPMLNKTLHSAAKEACDKMIKDLLAANATEVNGVKKPAKVAPENMCLVDGDSKERSEYEGHWIISAKEGKIHPTCRTRQGDLIMNDSEIDKVFYGGCFANVMIRFWYFGGTSKRKPGKTYPKRVCAGFVGIQFIEDGEPFGEGRIDDSDAWGAEDESGDDGLGRTSKSTKGEPSVDNEEF